MDDKVSIVIVTRNRENDVMESIESLLKSDYPDYEIIMVDNDSDDSTVKRVSENFPQVKIVCSHGNLGLTGGRNMGQQVATGKYILFIDSDTVVDRSMMRELVEAIKNHSRVAIAAPKMYSYLEPSVIWYAGAKFNMITSQATNIGAWTQEDRKFEATTEVSHAPTAFLVRRDLADQLGGHDHVFKMSYGDADFAFRMRRLGFKTIFVPSAKLYHKVQPTRQTKSLRSLGLNLPLRAYFFARNKVIFMKRHAKRHHFIIFMSIFFPAFAVYYSWKILSYSGGLRYLRLYWRGSFDGFMFALKTRWKNQTEKN